MRRPEIARYIRFSTKTVGRKYRRKVPLALFFLTPREPRKRTKPLFEARVGRDLLLNALNKLRIEYRDHGKLITIKGEPSFQRLIVYAGVRQFLTDDQSGADLLDIMAQLGEVETLFWATKFVEAYEYSGYWGVYRVAKAFRILHRL